MNLLNYESRFWADNFSVVGVDEVGRGAFAGPLVVSAVVWDKEYILHVQKDINSPLHRINDSKKISKKRRELLSSFIIKNCKEYKIIEVSSTEIDKYGVGEANKKAIVDAINSLDTHVDVALIDYFDVNFNDSVKVLPIVKGDSLSLSIASASIIAKVYRDSLMANQYHKLYPNYHFHTNVGYGTKAHREAIKKYGLSPVHRKSFSIK